MTAPDAAPVARLSVAASPRRPLSLTPTDASPGSTATRPRRGRRAGGAAGAPAGMEASGMLFLFSRPKENVRVPLRRAKVVLWAPQAAALRQRHASAGGVQGGCRHRMGYLPFGFGGRICVGRSLTGMEYRVVVAMVLRPFKLAVAPEYWHAPRVTLSLRPSDGVQLLLTPLQQHNK